MNGNIYLSSLFVQKLDYKAPTLFYFVGEASSRTRVIKGFRGKVLFLRARMFC